MPLALTSRRMAYNPFFDRLAHPEFNLVGNTLDLVYSQSICWLGMFYSPILPIATVIKCLIVFYVKYLSLLLYSSPPSRLYGASSSTSLFMSVLLLSFITCVLPLGYHVSSLTPSRSCGPYRGFSTVWSAISSEVLYFNLVPNSTLANFFYLGRSHAWLLPNYSVIFWNRWIFRTRHTYFTRCHLLFPSKSFGSTCYGRIAYQTIDLRG